MSKNPKAAAMAAKLRATQMAKAQQRLAAQQQSNSNSQSDDEIKFDIPLAMKCPIIAAAASAPLEEFVALVEHYEALKRLPQWPGLSLISSLKDSNLPPLFRIVDNDSQSNLLHYAALNTAEHVAYLIKRGLAPLVNLRNKHGNAPVAASLSKGDLEAVEVFLAAGADLSRPNQSGAIPLHSAVMSGSPAVVKLALSHTVDANKADNDGVTPLSLALERAGMKASVGKRAEAEAALVQRHRDDAAAAENSLDMSEGDEKALAEKEAALAKLRESVARADNELSIMAKTTAMLARDAAAAREVAMLVLERSDAHGAADGFPLLHVAAQYGVDVAVKALLAKGVDVNTAYGQQKSTALHIAAGKGQLSVVNTLLEAGADAGAVVLRPTASLPLFLAELCPEAKDRCAQYAPVYLAATAGHEDVVLALMERPGAAAAHLDVNTNATPAAATDVIDVVSAALGGVTMNAADTTPSSTTTSATAPVTVQELVRLLLPFLGDESRPARVPLLKAAALYNMKDATNVFLRAGARANVPHCSVTITSVASPGGVGAKTPFDVLLHVHVTDSDFTPLLTAARKGHTDIVKTLLAAGADPNLTFATWAQKRGIDISSLLVLPLSSTHRKQVGVRFTLTDTSAPAVAVAVSNGHAHLVHTLVAHGADLNQSGSDGLTAVHHAANKGETTLLAYMLSNGGSALQQDGNMLSPLALAARQDHYETVALILSRAPETIFDVAAANTITFAHQLLLNRQLPSSVTRAARALANTVPRDDKGVMHGAAVRALRACVLNGSVLSAQLLLKVMRKVWVRVSAPVAHPAQDAKAGVTVADVFAARVVSVPGEHGPVQTAKDSCGLAVTVVSADYAKMRLSGDKDAVYMPLSAYLATELLSVASQRGLLAVVVALLEVGGVPVLNGLQGSLFLDTFRSLYRACPDGRLQCVPSTPVVINNHTFSPLHAAIANNQQNIAHVLLGATPTAVKALHGERDDLHTMVDSNGNTLPPMPVLEEVGDKKNGKRKESSDDTIPTAVGPVSPEALVRLPAYLHPVAVAMLAMRVGSDGMGALHLCASEEHPLLAAMIIKAGVDINAQDSQGNTALHTAIRHSAIHTLNILIASAADANIKNKNGYSALHIAALFGRPALVKTLVEHCRGDVSVRTPEGKNVIELVNEAKTKESLLKNTSKKT